MGFVWTCEWACEMSRSSSHALGSPKFTAEYPQNNWKDLTVPQAVPHRFELQSAAEIALGREQIDHFPVDTQVHRSWR